MAFHLNSKLSYLAISISFIVCCQNTYAETLSQPPIAGKRPDVATLSEQKTVKTSQEVQGNIAELMSMLREEKLSEMRTTYNGSYGASLLFDSDTMQYYITLFQDKHFWRVFKTADKMRAQQVYKAFVKQTETLSAPEIHQTELLAQKNFTDRLIVLSENHANRLKADLSIAEQQEIQVANRQKQIQSETESLEAEKIAAQNQLRQLQLELQSLRQQAESGLPINKAN